MLRSILSDFPEWLLALLFIGAIVALTLGAYALVSRFLPDWRNRENLEGIRAVRGDVDDPVRARARVRGRQPLRRLHERLGVTDEAAAADQLNTFLAERENRVAKAGTEIPAPLLALLIFLALVTIAVSLLIQTHHRAVDLALVVVVSVIVASGLLTALILQYPYSGSIAVKSDPLAKGPLSHLGPGG